MDTVVSESRATDLNKVLAEVTGALVGHFKMTALLEKVVEKAMTTLHADVCSIFLIDRQDEPGFLIMRAGSGFASKLVGRSRYQIGEGFTGMVAKYGRRFNIKSREELETLEVEGERVWKGKFDNEQWPSGSSEFRNCIALPLTIKGDVLGVIKVENKLQDHGDCFSEQDENYFEIIANVVALAIENARLHEQIETQLKTIAAKAAHRIHNQVTNYDWIERELRRQVHSPIPDKHVLQDMEKRVSETTRSLKRMVGEFKSYGKPLVIETQLSDINGIIRNEIWLAKPPQSIHIEQSLSGDLLLVRLDAGRFAEAMKELLSNSIKAIVTNPAGTGTGTIHISTGEEVEEDAVDDATLRGGRARHVVVSIRDDGPGFPQNFPIFEPFQSTDPQSTGLGLATVKELVEAHGGQIETPRPEGPGAHILIRLPL